MVLVYITIKNEKLFFLFMLYKLPLYFLEKKEYFISNVKLPLYINVIFH